MILGGSMILLLSFLEVKYSQKSIRVPNWHKVNGVVLYCVNLAKLKQYIPEFSSMYRSGFGGTQAKLAQVLGGVESSSSHYALGFSRGPRCCCALTRAIHSLTPLVWGSQWTQSHGSSPYASLNPGPWVNHCVNGKLPLLNITRCWSLSQRGTVVGSGLYLSFLFVPQSFLPACTVCWPLERLVSPSDSNVSPAFFTSFLSLNSS